MGGGKKCPSQCVREEPASGRRKSLTSRLLHRLVPHCALALSCLGALALSSLGGLVLAGCADADIPQPSSPMTRADSIAAGLLVPVPTADGAWDGETVYDFDGNPIGQGSDTQIAVGGSDSDATEGDDGHTWGE